MSLPPIGRHVNNKNVGHHKPDFSDNSKSLPDLSTPVSNASSNTQPIGAPINNPHSNPGLPTIDNNTRQQSEIDLKKEKIKELASLGVSIKNQQTLKKLAKLSLQELDKLILLQKEKIVNAGNDNNRGKFNSHDVERQSHLSSNNQEDSREHDNNLGNLSEEYEKDPITGIVYKKMVSSPPELIEAFRKGGATAISIDQLSKHADPNFDVNDLNSEAKKFLPHLRVPPNKEEQEELRRNRAERIREQNKELEELLKKQAEEDEKASLNSFKYE